MSRSFFSVEVCFSFSRSAALHDRLARLVKGAPESQDPEHKWRLHRRVADALIAGLPEAERGCWEYVDDDGEDAMWTDWLAPLSDESRRPSGEEAGGYFTFTMMMQAKRHSPTDRVLARAFRASEGALWNRGTFAGLLQTLPALSFDSVVRDALYLMPRDGNRGFTEGELQTERMKYLRVLG